MISPNDTAHFAQTVKIVLAGSHSVGKTMIMWRWNGAEGTFVGKPTVGTDFSCREVTMEETLYKVHLWDTAGQETYHSITGPYFRSCNGVMLVFDITKKESFTNLNYWFKMIDDNAKEKPVITLIANKVDMRPTAVTDAEIVEFCQNKNVKCFQTSALTGYGIAEAFNDLINDVIILEKSRNHSRPPSITLQSNPIHKKKCC